MTSYNLLDEQLYNYEATIRGELAAYQLARQSKLVEEIWNKYSAAKIHDFSEYKYTSDQQLLYDEKFRKGIETITIDIRDQHIENPNDVKWPGGSRIRYHQCHGELLAIEFAREINFSRASLEEELAQYETDIKEFETTGMPERYKPSSSVRMNIDGVIIGLKQILTMLDDLSSN